MMLNLTTIKTATIKTATIKTATIKIMKLPLRFLESFFVQICVHIYLLFIKVLRLLQRLDHATYLTPRQIRRSRNKMNKMNKKRPPAPLKPPLGFFMYLYLGLYATVSMVFFFLALKFFSPWNMHVLECWLGQLESLPRITSVWFCEAAKYNSYPGCEMPVSVKFPPRALSDKEHWEGLKESRWVQAEFLRNAIEFKHFQSVIDNYPLDLFNARKSGHLRGYLEYLINQREKMTKFILHVYWHGGDYPLQNVHYIDYTYYYRDLITRYVREAIWSDLIHLKLNEWGGEPWQRCFWQPNILEKSTFYYGILGEAMHLLTNLERLQQNLDMVLHPLYLSQIENISRGSLTEILIDRKLIELAHLRDQELKYLRQLLYGYFQIWHELTTFQSELLHYRQWSQTMLPGPSEVSPFGKRFIGMKPAKLAYLYEKKLLFIELLQNDFPRLMVEQTNHLLNIMPTLNELSNHYYWQNLSALHHLRGYGNKVEMLQQLDLYLNQSRERIAIYDRIVTTNDQTFNAWVNYRRSMWNEYHDSTSLKLRVWAFLFSSHGAAAIGPYKALDLIVYLWNYKNDSGYDGRYS
jgi:hypothetical protein